MKTPLLKYLLISLLFVIPSTSFAGFVALNGDLFTIAETDTTNFQLFSFYDLRKRDSFVQVTNTGSAATLHIQVFDVGNLCNENNFNDSYTANDTHVYNMRDIQTNDGNPSGVELPDGAYGFVVVTVVQGNGQPADTSGLIIGNFRVIDNSGYEYRSNSQGFQPQGPAGSKYFINYNSVGGINKSDIVGITLNNLLSGEVTALGSSVTFETSIFNNNEVIFSCSDTTFSCTEDTFEYGINEAIPHSRDKSNVCGSNNIPEGFVRLEVIDHDETEAFIGFAGINTGNNSRGSMDALIAVRTPTCGDGILDIGETCDPPGGSLDPNGHPCRPECTFCGDGIVNGDEECDDGNDMEDDSCDNDCNLIVGGCCELVAPECVDGLISEADCNNMSNTFYLGDGTMCDTAANCQTGACCLEGGNDCNDITEEFCIGEGGEYQGDGTICGTQPTICVGVGACCLPDETCAEGTEDECLSAGGEYQTDGTTCGTQPTICGPPPESNCCIGRGGETGCDDQQCEDIICGYDDNGGIDPSCCSEGWDEGCATDANDLCPVCGDDDDDVGSD